MTTVEFVLTVIVPAAVTSATTAVVFGLLRKGRSPWQ